MDLGTMKVKIENKGYTSHLDFATDMRLVFTNCYKYNPPDHEIGQAHHMFSQFLNPKPLMRKVKTSSWKKSYPWYMVHLIFLFFCQDRNLKFSASLWFIFSWNLTKLQLIRTTLTLPRNMSSECLSEWAEILQGFTKF